MAVVIIFPYIMQTFAQMGKNLCFSPMGISKELDYGFKILI